MDDVFKKIVQQQFLKIGETKLEFEDKSNTPSPNIEEAIQSQILEEIKQKLFGRNATATGSIMYVHDELMVLSLPVETCIENREDGDLMYNSNSILNQIQQQLPTMQSALDAFNAYQNTLKMSTGSAELDSLIDSIQEGIFYLFYGIIV